MLESVTNQGKKKAQKKTRIINAFLALNLVWVFLETVGRPRQETAKNFSIIVDNV